MDYLNHSENPSVLNAHIYRNKYRIYEPTLLYNISDKYV